MVLARPHRPFAVLGLALVLLSACGGKPENGPASAAAEDDGASADSADATFDGGTEGGGAGGITAADAARGGGGTLPADSYGPSAYDLSRARADRSGGHPTIATEDPVSPPAAGTPDGGGEGADPSQSGGNVAAPTPASPARP